MRLNLKWLARLTTCAEYATISAVMSTLELVELARTVSREAFLAKVPSRFLVMGIGIDGQRPMRFTTQVLQVSERSTTDEQLNVLPLVKSANNPYADRLSIGRARNCDLMIRDSGVSKLHALIWIDNDTFTLMDVGSQNGTFLNGRKLTPNEASPLARNDELSFGSVPATFMDAAGVHSILKTAAATAL